MAPRIRLAGAWAALGLVGAQGLHAQGPAQRLDAAVPRGQNLRARPEQPTDVVLGIDRSGGYFLNGVAVVPSRIGSQLSAMFSAQTSDRILYVRADARLNVARINTVSELAVKSGICVASMIGEQEPGTASRVVGDFPLGQGLDSSVRRAIDVQLPSPNAPALIELTDTPIALEVLPGPTYRINSVVVPTASLATRLSEIFNPRPVKVLFVLGDSTATFGDVFHAIDLARGAGVIVVRAAPAGRAVPDRLPNIDLSTRVTAREGAVVTTGSGNTGRCRRDTEAAYSAVQTAAPVRVEPYFEFQVDTRVKQIAGTAPRYPDVLRLANVSGEVLGQFVVNVDGRADTATFHVIRSTHDLFTQAVKATLADLRFAPATIGGKPVRQLVQMPFLFSITPARDEQVRAAEMSRRDALLASDTVALSRLVASEFVEISRLGTLRSRADNLREVATGDLKLLTIKYDSLDVRVYGDVAILTGIADNTGTYHAMPFAGKIRYTRVFVWRDGRWQAVSMQQTPMQ